MHNTIILLFLKSPVKGGVKTRLSKTIGEDPALHVYKSFGQGMIKTLEAGKYPFRLCFYPPDSGEIVKSWLGSSYSYLPQQGQDLGERMKNAMTEAFSTGMKKVLLIGSDIPALTKPILNEALTALDNNNAVIGPAVDGGYYLIGFNNNTFLPDIFHGIEWSTGSVFTRTMDLLRGAGLSVHTLEELTDIDTFDDLQSFIKIKPGNKYRRVSFVRALKRSVNAGI